MTSTLKATAAVIALTAGSAAWAQTAATGDVSGSGSLDADTSVSTGTDLSAVDTDTTVKQGTSLDADTTTAETDMTTETDLSADTDMAAETDTSTTTDIDAAEAEIDAQDDTTDTASSVTEPADDSVAQAEANSSTQTVTTGETMVDSFSGMVASDLVGLNIVEANGEDVGEIDNIVRYNGELAAIIGVGGFLGLGEHQVAVPLSEISRAAEGDLKLSTRTNAEIEAMTEVDAAEYEELEDDAPLDSGV